MIKHYLTVSCLFFSFLFVSASNTTYSGERAETICEDCQTVMIKDFLEIPSFIRFVENKGPNPNDVVSWISEKFEISTDLRLVSVKEFEDHFGFRHIRFQQYLGDLPIEFAEFTAHIKDGKTVSLSGDIFKELQVSGSQIISAQQAINAAKEHIGATTYKWEIPAEEAHLKEILNDPTISYQPQPQLCAVASDGKFTEANYRVAYKLKIYADQPESHHEIFIDAENASVVFKHSLIHTADTNGLAKTGYSDTVAIVGDATGNGFRLFESGRGGGIRTLNLEERTQANSAIEFTDADHFWDNVNPQLDQYATDAHWGAEMTYDYLLARFNRNSVNDNGYRLTSFVHYDENWFNASWNGFSMRYGDGNGKPFTTLDIAGHEIGHGVTSNTARLIYQDESGALNESFSDILGVSIEFFVKGNDANWRIGEDVGNALRSMSNPRQYNDPSTYQGIRWVTGPADNGGVHTNSGVQNYWYYLLTEGGSGKNDNDSLFDVDGIGIEDASQIAYRNLAVYLTPTSTYTDAAFFAIQSAIDLYGSCSEQHKQTVNAWHAVGLSEPYEGGATSDFNVEQKTACQAPFLAKFTDASVNAIDYNWDFGNGETSTVANPEALYTEPGEYTITLVIDGGGCGKDSITKTNYININPLEIPVAEKDTTVVCTGEKAMLKAIGNGESIKWYGSIDSDELLFEGEEYETAPLSAAADFYAETYFEFETTKVGPASNGFGTNSISSSSTGLLFDVFSPMVLESVLIYAGGSKERTIAVLNNNDEIVHEKTVLIEGGPQRVQLGFKLDPAPQYEIKFNSSSPNASAVREFANFPYESAGICSITGHTAPPQDQYFYFFDWEVKKQDCVSERKQVHASISCLVPEVEKFNGFKLFPNPSSDGFKITYYTGEEGYLEAEIYNLNGQLVKDFGRIILDEPAKEVYLSTTDIAVGVYYLRVETDNENFSERIVISRN